ncbi:aldehyde ferredoxin oxidoreductase, partial [candidate division KSB1 bacterium]|nr:aldehyde ferredoxin oxidoreductase [candidate division KSB1 bacterium]
MNKIIGTSNRVLEVNLTHKTVTEFHISRDERRLFLGGKGLGLKLLYERLTPGIDPLGSENILVFMMGVFMGTGAPCSGRFAALTKSPLTGILVSSSCGGPFGMAYKTAGYDGLIIIGKSDVPVYLAIDHKGVKFEIANKLWGLDTEKTQKAIAPDGEGGSLAIGQAGENKVLFANVASGGRFFGRGGIGAVMGAKKLKAIVAFGKTHKIVPVDQPAFDRIKSKAIRYINHNIITAEKYRFYGTASNVNYCNDGNILPVRNFSDGQHEKAHLITGEFMKEKYGAKPKTCVPCSILCGHVGKMADNKVRKIPEYESTALLGPNLGIFDSDIIEKWNDQCGRLGLDTISTGLTLSYLMEAGEKGLVETDLQFGNPVGIEETIENIAWRRGFGDEIANGSRWLSEKYGGNEFAIQVKGLEMGAYDPRGAWGQGLSYAVANRGACHLSATTFALEVFFNFLKPNTTRAKANFVRFFENMYSSLNSMQTCLFTAFAYALEPPIVKYT